MTDKEYNKAIKEMCKEINKMFKFFDRKRMWTDLDNSYIIRRLDGKYELISSN